ncbi:hypothetical protein D9613_010993 [Agrocybe pediades]|uniref:Uncharacterized protein n=1 Tax=Agrocybe pediades TaxID=84607 RepID=A0A8H4VKF2_9AGAR|nr:hypothetical protein D9613_010993 [Agrocybe pediades]
MQWYREAAHAIFSVDEDESIREELKHEPERFTRSVRDQVEKFLPQKYKIFNSYIGKGIANMGVEEIKPGTPEYAAVERRLVFFPLWKRLHVYWGTNTLYNVHYEEQDGETSDEDTRMPQQSKLLTGARLSRGGNSVREKKPERASVISISDSDTESEESPLLDSPTGHKVKQTREKTPFPYRTVEVSPGRLKKGILKRKREDDDEPSTSGSSKIRRASSTTIEYPATQKERELQLAIELKKLENEALEKRTELRRLEIEAQAEERRRQAEHENQRAKEKHDFLMKMMAMAGAGTPGALKFEI